MTDEITRNHDSLKIELFRTETGYINSIKASHWSTIQRTGINVPDVYIYVYQTYFSLNMD